MSSERSSSSDTPAPLWDRHFPGRFQSELDAFAAAGVVPSINQDALADGRLELNFEWRLDNKLLPLRAAYPDSYPFLRPQIFVTDPAFLPKRHYSPLDGNLCLIGRDTRQWASSWTVPQLLREQMRGVFEGSADEDPQAEPAEVWWNTLASPSSYCLIDSSWSLLTIGRPGKLKLFYTAKLDTSGDPVFQAIVTSITDASGQEIAKWNGTLPNKFHGKDVQEIEIPWSQWKQELLPKPPFQDPTFGLEGLLANRANRSLLFDFREQGSQQSSMRGQLHAFVYPTETQFGRRSDAWLFVVTAGKRKAFYPNSKEPVAPLVVRTLRAGPSDLRSRAIPLTSLSDKTVTVIGLGAVGAPIAIELARNGVGKLKLLDHDVVEPGNSIRWPLGATAWGEMKARALADFIASEYPHTKVSFVKHFLGAIAGENSAGDSTVLGEILEKTDVVVDGTASFGATCLIRDEVRKRSLPLIALYASPSVAGGVVALYTPKGACPVCLEFAWDDDEEGIAAPPGMFEESGLIQPPGCAERTFSGTSFDLQELSLQATRVVAGLLTRGSRSTSTRVYTLAFEDNDGIRAPTWRRDDLPPHSKCTCHQ